jgi:hypothetical protein
MLREKIMLRRSNGGLNRKSPLKRKPWEHKEHRDAVDFGGKTIPGSGNKWWNPGDIKTADFLIQDKQTEKKSFSITQDLWTKTCKEANESGKLPALSIELGDGTEIVAFRKVDFMSWFSDVEVPKRD